MSVRRQRSGSRAERLPAPRPAPVEAGNGALACSVRRFGSGEVMMTLAWLLSVRGEVEALVEHLRCPQA